MTYHRVAHTTLPMALADLHHTVEVGGPVDLEVDGTWQEAPLRDVLVGAGFDVGRIAVEADAAVIRAGARRARTLADTVGPGMGLLVCGLNPSVYSADRGVGYARPGNRFWKAVVAAGLVAPDRALRPAEVLRHDGIGITDLCKRATVASAELAVEEYRAGTARVERLVRWLRPQAVCFVGLEGYRAAIDRKAVAGPQPVTFGDRPAYVLPSTSGLNAHSRLEDLVAHFSAAATLTA